MQKNRKEKKMAARRNWVAASYYAANHFGRLAAWAMSQVMAGQQPVDFSGKP